MNTDIGQRVIVASQLILRINSGIGGGQIICVLRRGDQAIGQGLTLTPWNVLPVKAITDKLAARNAGCGASGPRSLGKSPI